MSWQVVDAAGAGVVARRGLGRHRAPSPAAAVAAAPVAVWPMRVVADDGRAATVAQALGPGGEGVEHLLDALVSPPPDLTRPQLDALATVTPAGNLTLPVEVVDVAAAVEAAGGVDRSWLALVERRRAAPRPDLVERGRAVELEAALHLAMLLGTEHLASPPDDAETKVASGALLWLLGGAVAWCLTGAARDPFRAWAELVVHRWWPVGPVGGRLVAGRFRPAT